LGGGVGVGNVGCGEPGVWGGAKGAVWVGCRIAAARVGDQR
jgi:hypothetical protein